jgi:acyl dehydratase
MRILQGSDGLRAALGSELGVSDWLEVSQDDVNAFADVTGDHQWIHVDVERAKDSQFGGTIAHGFFTLSLAPRLQSEVFRIDGFDFGLNYGLNKVRFPSPTPVGSRVRLRVALTELTDVPGGMQALLINTFECEGIDKPVCIAEMLVRVYGEGQE